MFKINWKLRTVLLALLIVSSLVFGSEEALDTQRYIGIDEIKPGMEAYCLTSYKGTSIEKFSLEVLSVVRNVVRNGKLARNLILVQGTDERFIHSGPVAGCSGSPVYIDGRLAGALAYAWTFSKDPLYEVTPIEEMLSVGRADFQQAQNSRDASVGFSLDFTNGIDFAEIESKLLDAQYSGRSVLRQGHNFEQMPLPLAVSGLPTEVVEQLNSSMKPFGLMAVAGAGGENGTQQVQNTKLVPGASLAIPLVTGDISIAVTGTVTEVVGDDVYAFGHYFLGYGKVDFPMATAQVHTVVSNMVRSFKFASPLEIVGAVRFDEQAAVRGRIGAQARLIPLTVKVDRYNDTQKRLYNCRVIDNRILTPQLVQAVIAGAALMRGSLPPDNLIEYKVNIGVEGADSISFSNISSTGLGELATESTGSVMLLMNNPYKKVNITSIDLELRIMPKNINSSIWSVDLSDTKVSEEDEIEVSVILESVLAGKKQYKYRMRIPQGTEPGTYDLIVTGGNGYLDFLQKKMPHRFIPQNIDSLVEAIHTILEIERDRLYCLLVLPTGGITVEQAELPDLPATKAMVLSDVSRTLTTQPYPHWLEKSIRIDTITSDTKLMRITVEK